MLRGAIQDKAIGALRQSLGEDHSISLVQKRDLLKDVEDLKTQLVAEEKKQANLLIETAKKIGEEYTCTENAKAIVASFDALKGDMKALSETAGVLSKKFPNLPMLILSPSTEKVSIVSLVPKALSGSLSAKEWTSEVFALCNGKGGGNPTKAQGFGTDVSKLEECAQAANLFVENKL